MHRSSILGFLLGAFFVGGGLSSLAIAAPPKVDYFFPTGAQRGQSVSVTAVGSLDAWTVKTWVDREGLTVEAGEKKGELKITVAPEAAGVYWLRLYDDEGASALRPIVVGALPEVVEAEPNNDPRKPQALDGPAVVNGKLAKRGDVDAYSMTLKAEQTLVASLLANNLFNSPMDGVLQVANAEGFVLAQNDDARGLDPLLVFTAPRDGAYQVRTFAFPAEPNSSINFAGGENFLYRLTMTTGPLVDHTLPLAVRENESTELRLVGWNLAPSATVVAAPEQGWLKQIAAISPRRDLGAATLRLGESLACAGALELPIVLESLSVATAENSPQAPQAIETPAMISGCIETPKDLDAFRFTAKKGQKIVLRAESRSLGFELDAVLEVTDAAGKSLAEDDDARDDRDPTLNFTAPADGEYIAIIRDLYLHGGLRYAYRLSIEEEKPDYRLTLAADSFTLMPGMPLEIPVTVDRKNGFDGEIEVTAEGLPAGVIASAVKSLPKGDAAKTVKLTLTAETGPASAAFTITGRSDESERDIRTARFTIPGLSSTHTQAWLTVARPN